MTDYEKLVKALTCGNDGKLPCHNNECPYWVDQWHGIGLCNVIKKDADAAAVIEELQAELAGSKDAIRILKYNLEMKKPKRGEWIRIDKHTIQCPLCHRYLDLRGVNAGRGDANYCPNCGAKMEVQE